MLIVLHKLTSKYKQITRLRYSSTSGDILAQRPTTLRNRCNASVAHLKIKMLINSKLDLHAKKDFDVEARTNIFVEFARQST